MFQVQMMKVLVAFGFSVVVSLVVGSVTFLLATRHAATALVMATVVTVWGIYLSNSFTGWFSRIVEGYANARALSRFFSKERWYVANVKRDIKIFRKKKTRLGNMSFSHDDGKLIVMLSRRLDPFCGELVMVSFSSESLDAAYLNKLGELVWIEYPFMEGVRYIPRQ